MFIVKCKEDGYTLPSEKVNILILNVEKMTETKQSELYYEITSDKYLDQIVVVVDINPEKLVGYPQIAEYEVIPLDAKDKVEEELKFETFEDMQSDINRLVKNIKNILSKVRIDKKSKKRILNCLEQNLIVNNKMPFKKGYLKKIDFWYDLDLVNPDNLIEPLIKWEEGLTNKFKSDDSKKSIHFKIEHDLERDSWSIYKNNDLIKNISYSRSKGMKYLAILSKYYNQKTISDTKLRSVVDKWHGKSKKTAEKSTDAKKILQDLIYFFEKQCPELSPLRECVIISSKAPGCYFEIKNNISVEFVDPFIPQSI